LTTFESLGVPADLIAVLAEQGIDAPFAIQKLTIADGLAGRDVCGKAQTGSGKTLAFSLPIVAHTKRADDGHPTALVLVPTRELAVQVAEVVVPLSKARGLRSLAVYGGTNIEKQIAKIEAGLEIIVATPGRLIDLIDRKAMDVKSIQRVVIDEADRMADMGFLPQVEWILRHIKVQHQTMLFSATLDGAVDHVVKRHLKDPVRHEVETSQATVAEMDHVFLNVHEMDKAKVAAAIIDGVDKTILFTRTKRGADRLVSNLIGEGINVAAIHGDLRQRAREAALRDFTTGKISALVATDVAARGIHVDDIQIVIHYDPADDHKAYVHRSGRTARAGSKGVAVTLAIWNEEVAINVLQRRLKMKLPPIEVFSNDERLRDLSTLIHEVSETR